MRRHPKIIFASAVITGAFLFSSTLTATEPLSIDCLSVSAETGKVIERYKGAGERTLIQIQDVHAHFTAQENIAAILEHLRTGFQVDKVALEGAWTSTELPQSRAIPTSREKQLLARTLLENNLITGPIYAALLSPLPIQLTGIEDAELYEQNRTLYLAHLEALPEINKKLAAYHERMIRSQKMLWNRDLLSFAGQVSKFRELGDLGSYLPETLNAAAQHDISTADFDQILLIKEIMAKEKQLRGDRLQDEIRSLIRDFKNTPYSMEELLRGNKIPEERLGFYPEIKTLRELTVLKDRISLAALREQMDTLAETIVRALAKTEDELALWDKNKRFFVARDILLLQATPDTLRLAEKELSLIREEFNSARLSRELELCLKFYAIVKQRDDIFMKKILESPHLQGTLAVVTGGFHTDGLSEKLRKAGISYITISPELGNEKWSETLYEQRMTEDLAAGLTASALKEKDIASRENEEGKIVAREPATSVPEPSSSSPAPQTVHDQTLSDLRNRLEVVDERFPPAFATLTATRNIQTALEVYQGRKTPAVSDTSSPAHGQASGLGALLNHDGAPLDFETFRRLPKEVQRSILANALEESSAISRPKIVVVARASVLKNLIDEKNAGPYVRELVARDFLATAMDIPPATLPEELLGGPGIRRYEDSPGIAEVLSSQDLRRRTGKIPPVVIDSEYESHRLLVLQASVPSLLLYRLLEPGSWLYEAAVKNPGFLSLLENLVAEILSEGLVQRAA